MNRQFLALALIALFTVGAGTVIMSADPPAPTNDHDRDHDDHDAHDHDGHDDHDDRDHDDGTISTHIEITPEAAVKAGVTIETAGTAQIADTVMSMGSIVLDPSGHARTSARFSGIVRRIGKNIGDPVKAGEVLATVESNESLQTYDVRSPIDGVVIARFTNVGEITSNEPLFEVANLSRVWAEVHVFPRDLARVRADQRVMMKSPDGLFKGEGTIAALLPVADAPSQSVVVRIPLENPDGVWRPGMTVIAHIVSAEHIVAVAVHADAIQRLDAKPVVFVEHDDEFEVRPVTLGVSDGMWVEILDGVRAGERYAAGNSYLFKADLGKESAEHEH